ncbi:putative transporter [Pseudoloma neurophilia]|uniref:Putative transporter n=1 Tax=Pseudoloma neurophilia TaxID=146866 RepID=A0A0R0LSP0_9MICR|nr:putative transporter [Pseudoloma neurophilia]
MINKNKVLRTKIWLFSNQSFILTYALYILSWIVIIPPINHIPRLFFNTIIAISYLSAIDPENITADALMKNSNLFFSLFFMTNPGLLFALPFFILSIVNTSRMMIKQKFRYQILQKIDQQRHNFVFISYLLKYIFLVPLMIGLMTGHSRIASIVIYFYFLKISYENDQIFKETLFYLVHQIDRLSFQLPIDQQKMYGVAKKKMLEYFKSSQMTMMAK